MLRHESSTWGWEVTLSSLEAKAPGEMISRAPWVGMGVLLGAQFFKMPPHLFLGPISVSLTKHDAWQEHQPGIRLHVKMCCPPQPYSPCTPPHNCENSEKLKRENKHVLTIWDSVQLTAISNIYCKILTLISGCGGDGSSSAHKIHPFFTHSSSAPRRGKLTAVHSLKSMPNQQV